MYSEEKQSQQLLKAIYLMFTSKYLACSLDAREYKKKKKYKQNLHFTLKYTIKIFNKLW